MQLLYLITTIGLGVVLGACSTGEYIKAESGDSQIISATLDSLVYNDSTLTPSYVILTPARDFTIDKLQQVYLITNRNEVIKHDPSGREVFRFNNNFLEDIGKLDPSNPFNLILYYPEFLSVITLDRTMSQTGEFNLSQLNLIRVDALGSTNDNNVWLYDAINFSLKKINSAGQVLKESVNLNLKLGYSGNPNFLIERSNLVFVNDPKYGILVFSNIGEFDSVLDIKGLDYFQVLGDQIVYQRGTRLYRYHLQSLNEKEIKLPVKINPGDKVLLQKNRLFVKRPNRLEVYEL
jgi:hypothetical protein